MLGQDLGIFDLATNASLLNTRNPPLRDTTTLPQGGWSVVRFVADNPGTWIMHCHLLWHELMGQVGGRRGAGAGGEGERGEGQFGVRLAMAGLSDCEWCAPLTIPMCIAQVVVFGEALNHLPQRPKGLPRCPNTCQAGAAPWVSARERAGGRGGMG